MATLQASRPGRVERRPSYPFSIMSRPFQIIPFLLAPVLPGETLKNAMLQSRVVTDPLKSPFIGWHKEFYFFSVRLRDLAGAEDFEEMMLDPNKDMSAYNSAASQDYFHAGGINWRKLALDKVVEHYFRIPDDPNLAAAVDGMPAAAVDMEDVFDSAIRDVDFVGEIDQEVDLNDDGTITTQEVDKAMRMWQFARANQLTEMDFDDYLRTFGIRVPTAYSDKPELIRFIREWQYPSNTIDPVTGKPTSAVSWSIRDRIDKNRMFREPGFIIGLTVARPKIYLGNHIGSFTSRMNDALSWLPAIMRDDPYTSMRKMESDAGWPVANQTGDYWIDIKDLFLYGEQYVNHNQSFANKMPLPRADLSGRYLTWEELRTLFVDDVAGDFTKKQWIREDGIINLTIAGALKDTTPPVARLAV